MSKGTLNTMIALLRQQDSAQKGLSTTSSAIRAMKNQIPINTLDYNVDRPGFAQADTVSHCGNSALGPFLSSVTLTDVHSAWTVNHAIASKKALQVRDAFIAFKQQLPFPLLAVNTDSGSEFLNTPVINFMADIYVKKPIIFTRSRPYHKNDNSYVEQKNFTHVRQLFGYERFEDPKLVDLMNEIYVNYWNPLHNFFLPSQKLKEKIRIGAKMFKKFEYPQTPYDRLLNSKHLSEDQKQKLWEAKEKLNPFELAEGLELKLSHFYQLVKQLKLTRNAA